MRCRATFALIDMSCHQQLTQMLQSFALDNLHHKPILVGENKGSAQNRSRFWTCTLPCNFCLDSSVIPSAVHADAATLWRRVTTPLMLTENLLHYPSPAVV